MAASASACCFFSSATGIEGDAAAFPPVSPPDALFVAALEDAGVFPAGLSSGKACSSPVIPRLLLIKDDATPEVRLYHIVPADWPTRAPILAIPAAPDKSVLVYGNGWGFNSAIAGDIRGSSLYAIGSVG